MSLRKTVKTKHVVQSSSASLLAGKQASGLPSSNGEVLEVEEIIILPARRSIPKKRIASRDHHANLLQRLDSITSSTEHSPKPVDRLPEIIKKVSEERDNLPILRKPLMSKIISEINLSMISESKNQSSKLETPLNTHKGKQTICHQESTKHAQTTFSKWTTIRKPAQKKDFEFSNSIQCSDDNICELSINPCLTSFREDISFSQVQNHPNLSFKDYISNSCQLLPSRNNFKLTDISSRQSRSKSRNKAVRKILEIENLFESKGVRMGNFKKEGPKNEILKLAQISNYEDSIVKFQNSDE